MPIGFTELRDEVNHLPVLPQTIIQVLGLINAPDATLVICGKTKVF
ncbi:hypothetical protein MFMK1_002826 [Metallumcola ferriviriculae]|uniref:Uncharacterized protein n=1 Tax=Metallumcola ferriviriculae TaxID=3039180 RepID=A0AAU0URR9_9FIRM|nr:hypothetical protein MFMK1_002826 [Desulfitibacteraceae bacterium MK1]